jgi:hypothetical protein
MSNVVRLEYAYGVCPKCKRVHHLRYLIHNDGLIHKPYEIKCINCNSYFAKEDILGSGEETAPKPITNADRIREMSDVELAGWLEGIRLCCATDLCGRRCPFWEVCYSNANEPKEMLDWLKEEAT